MQAIIQSLKGYTHANVTYTPVVTGSIQNHADLKTYEVGFSQDNYTIASIMVKNLNPIHHMIRGLWIPSGTSLTL